MARPRRSIFPVIVRGSFSIFNIINRKSTRLNSKLVACPPPSAVLHCQTTLAPAPPSPPAVGRNLPPPLPPPARGRARPGAGRSFFPLILSDFFCILNIKRRRTPVLNGRFYF